MAFETPASACPVCKKLLNRASGLRADERAPKPGDCTLCVECASFLRFTRKRELRLMTEHEIARLPDGLRLRLERARIALRAVKAARRETPEA